MSWRTKRAKEVWEAIYDGDFAQYHHTNWGDIPKGSMECIEGDWSDYDVETHINKTFLENGYQWVEVGNDDMALMTSSKIFHRKDFSDFGWFHLMKHLGENLPEEYCDIFDRHGEISEDYSDIFNVDVYKVE